MRSLAGSSLATCVIVALLLGCSGAPVVLTPTGVTNSANPGATPSPTPVASTAPTATPLATASATPLATPTATALASATPTPVATSTATNVGAFTPPTGPCVLASGTLTSAGGTLALPSTAGFSGNVVVPSNNVGSSGLVFSVNVCPGGNPPSAVSKTVISQFLAQVGGTPIFFVELEPLSQPVTYSSTKSSFSITLPPTAFPPGGAATNYYVGGCDESSCAVKGPVSSSIPDVVGPLPLSGSTLSIASTDPSLSMALGPPTLTAPAGYTVIAFIYASPFSPQLQYRHIREFAARHR